MTKKIQTLIIILLVLPWIVGFTIYGRDLQEVLSEGAFVDGDKTKLDAVDPTAYLPSPVQFTVILPNSLADATRDRYFLYSNDTTYTQTIGRIISWSDTDDTVYEIYECTGWSMASCASIQTLTIATDGTVGFYNTVSSLDLDIETGHVLYLDFDDTDTPGQVKGTVEFK